MKGITMNCFLGKNLTRAIIGIGSILLIVLLLNWIFSSNEENDKDMGAYAYMHATGVWTRVPQPVEKILTQERADEVVGYVDDPKSGDECIVGNFFIESFKTKLKWCRAINDHNYHPKAR